MKFLENIKLFPTRERKPFKKLNWIKTLFSACPLYHTDTKVIRSFYS